MKYAVVSFLRRAVAAILAFFTSVFGGGTALLQPPEKEANVISAYSEEAADYLLTADAANRPHEISDLLFGAFFEDINFAADGGLYAEMVANRSFEFTSLAAGDSLYHWAAVNGASLSVQTDPAGALNANNPSYLTLTNGGEGLAGAENTGFLEGMAVKAEDYRFSVYARGVGGFAGPVTVRLTAGDETLAEGEIPAVTGEWEKYTLILRCGAARENVRLQTLAGRGSVCLDMVSLFPVETYKNRENGMRRDLAEALEAMHPKFLRFPGGCVIEGYNVPTAYSWKDSIGVGADGEPLSFGGVYGDVAARRQGENIWTDHSATEDPWPSFMTYGLGFYEFFQFSEDIGAVGVPIC